MELESEENAPWLRMAEGSSSGLRNGLYEHHVTASAMNLRSAGDSPMADKKGPQ